MSKNLCDSCSLNFELKDYRLVKKARESSACPADGYGINIMAGTSRLRENGKVIVCSDYSEVNDELISQLEEYRRSFIDSFTFRRKPIED